MLEVAVMQVTWIAGTGAESGSCDNGLTCPQVLETDRGTILVQGYSVDDRAVIAKLAPPEGELLAEVPRDLYLKAARRLERVPVTEDEVYQVIKRLQHGAFRLETLPQYSIPEDAERLRVFRETGRPPKRTTETSPWLRLIADSTAAGRHWRRVHVVSRPLTEYLRFELLGYQENAAAGEDIWIADQDTHPALVSLTEDFWLFDADTDQAVAVFLRYDQDGRFLGAERADHPDAIARCRAQRDLALALAVPLEEYLASSELDTDPVKMKTG
jgi:hypothetical protein